MRRAEGKWIAGDFADSHEPSWPEAVWMGPSQAPAGEAWYRHVFTVAEPAELGHAVVRLSGRHRTDIHLNGRLLKRCVHWVGTYEVDLWHHLKAGRNVLAIAAVDKERFQPWVAPVLCLRAADGSDAFATGAEDWRCTAGPAPAEWAQTWFDDRGWSGAVAKEPLRAGTLPDKGPRSLVFSRSFELEAAPRSARLRVTGLGLYELRINGRKAGDEQLTPGWTEYDRRIEYQEFDVGGLLTAGANRVEILTGNGWWLLHHRDFAATGVDRSLKAWMELDIERVSGAPLRIVTDGSWRASPSAVLMNHLYYGETVDCGSEEKEQPVVPVRELPAQAPLVPHAAEPIRCVERMRPIALRRTGWGSWIVDFGQNIAGWVELEPPRTGVARVGVRHAEELRPDGSLNTDSLRTAQALDTYLRPGPGSGRLAPRFTYHGFRYAEILGWPDDLRMDDLRACVVHADLRPAGRFHCSEPLFNRLFDAVRRTFRGNFHAVPTDCPQRDERLGWMADAGNIPDVAALYFDVSRFFDKWVVDMEDAQAKSGHFPDFAPSMGASERGSAHGAPGWADAGVKVPWELYCHYGDTARLRAHYPAMRRHVETMIRESRDGLFPSTGWGDWLAVEASPAEPVGTAYFYHSTDLLARAARVLGNTDEAERHAGLLQRIAEAYQRAYYNPESATYANGTQTMNALPLYMGITPEHLRAAVLRSLIDDLRAHEHHLTTGFLGTTFLFEVLARAGQHELIHTVLTRLDYPGHGRILNAGATTMTEAWNACLGDDFASHNHFNLGAPVAWFIRHLAGIQLDPERPGGRRFLVRPVFLDALDHAEGEWTGPCGRIASAWRRESGGLRLEVTVPAGAAALLSLPDASSPIVLEPGTRTFHIGSTHLKKEQKCNCR
ncbi:MAG: family 78 glycoside hydrolase catalytic domain [Oceanipulchritudo sp.]